MPRQLQPVSLATLPSNAENARERRRILNILAQRRYRRRKHARLAASLENKQQENALDSDRSTPSEEHACTSHKPAEASASGAATTSAMVGTSSFATSGVAITDSADCFPSYLDFSFCSPGSMTQSDWDAASTVNDFDPLLGLESAVFQDPTSDTDLAGYASSGLTENAVDNVASRSAMTPLAFLRCPAVDAMEAQPQQEEPTEREPDVDQLNACFNAMRISVPALSLVKAHFTVLSVLQRLLGLTRIDIFDPQSVSPFYAAPTTHTTFTLLPKNYRPTLPQRTVTHHPIFDLLPWPSVRERILQFMCLPQEARPTRARGDMSTVTERLMSDQKDADGGLRVWGNDVWDSSNWEIGQTFFENWWWALSTDIVQNSNKLRKQRGEDTLRMRKPDPIWQMVA